MKYIKKIFIPFFLIIISSIFFSTNIWKNLELKAYDILFSIRHNREISNDVVIVSIDDETFASLDARWPFKRRLYAKLIHNLEDAGAKTIVFDIEFTENSATYDDSIFTEELNKYNNIVLAGKIYKYQDGNYTKLQLIKPLEKFRIHNDWGIVNIVPDIDQFVRKYSIYDFVGKDIYYSLGLTAYGNYLYGNVWRTKIQTNNKFFNLGNLSLNKNTIHNFLINFSGAAGTIKNYPFSQVVDDSTFTLPVLDIDSYYDLKNENAFKNKIVFIGATADELHDVFPTPFLSGKKLMSGVEIHANFVDSILMNKFIHKLNLLQIIILIFIVNLIFYIINSKIKPSRSILISLLSIIIYWIIAYFFFTQKLSVLPILIIPGYILISYLFGFIFQHTKLRKERKFIKFAFERYLSADIVEELLENPKKLQYGGKEKEISILFTDIRSFTTFTESHNLNETIPQLREYFTEMVKAIKKNRGMIDKFIGDAIMAIFGDPIYDENHALSACKAALNMQTRLSKLQKKWKNDGVDIFVNGIGINSGNCIVGNLGSEQIFDYTAIGDTVNLASRLESANKVYPTKSNIIISEYTYELAKEKIIAKYLDETKVKGKEKSVKIYELIGIKE
jgi:adenylate cyclase